MIYTQFNVESHANGAINEYYRDGFKAYKLKLSANRWEVRAWK